MADAGMMNHFFHHFQFVQKKLNIGPGVYA